MNKYYQKNISFEDEDVNDIKSNLKEEIKEDDNFDFHEEIIEQIINIKYKDDADIFKSTEDKEFNKFLIKIIWLEANKNYNLSIIDLFEKVKNTIYGNKNILLEQINNLIKNNKVKYIKDENRNPEHRTEVNERFAIILGTLYLSITDLKRIVLAPDNDKDYIDYIEAEENQIKVKINKYLECLEYIAKVGQLFNDKLYLF